VPPYFVFHRESGTELKLLLLVRPAFYLSLSSNSYGTHLGNVILNTSSMRSLCRMKVLFDLFSIHIYKINIIYMTWVFYFIIYIIYHTYDIYIYITYMIYISIRERERERERERSSDPPSCMSGTD
jgi:pilus assembly protein TadC